MSFKSKLTALAAFSILALSSQFIGATPATADQIVTFTLLPGFGFSDGGSASGSFNFDNNTGTVTSVSITTTMGSTFPGTSYTNLNTQSFVSTTAGITNFDFRQTSPNPFVLQLATFASPPYPTPLTIELLGGFDLSFEAQGFATRNVNEGASVLVTAVVPGPIAGAGLPGLIAAASGLIAWRRRRKIA
jgi:hypothetical protein